MRTPVPTEVPVAYDSEQTLSTAFSVGATPGQRELIPLFKNLLGVPREQREHSQWQFGRPMAEK